MLKELIRPDIEELLEKKDYAGIKEGISDWENAEIADLLVSISPEHQPLLFRLLPRGSAGEVFSLLPTEDQLTLLHALGTDRTRLLLEELAPDDRTGLFEELPAPVTQKLMNLLSPDEMKIARRLLGYPEESVGRMMTTEYIALHPEWTVRQALDHIRKQGKDAETINVTYVIDEKGKLIDELRLRQLILAEPEDSIKKLMTEHFIALSAFDDQETAARLIQRYDRIALPVTDSEGILLGIVTVDDVLDVVQEEVTEDIQKMAAVEKLDDPYMNTAFFQLMRKRAGWLSILFLGESLTATAMGYYESEIQRAVVLALFIPLIISSGGNSGSQAVSLIIRALALEEIKLGDWWRVMLRELASGVALGGILGTIAFFRVLMWPNHQTLYGEHYLLVGITVACSLVGVVIWGTLSGSMLPFIMRRLGFDPAASSAPFVATLVDVTGVVIYFTLASLILRGSLL